MLKTVPFLQCRKTSSLQVRMFSQEEWVSFWVKVNFLPKPCKPLPSAPYSCKTTIPVLSELLTKQDLSRCEIQRKKTVKFCAFKKTVLISPGSKFQLKVQKIRTTNYLSFPWHTSFIGPMQRKPVVERLLSFASIFMLAGSQSASLQLRLQYSSEDLWHPLLMNSTLKMPKICSPRRKKIMKEVQILNVPPNPLHPALQVSVTLPFSHKSPSYCHHPSCWPAKEAWQHFLLITWSHQSLWMTSRLTAWTYYTHRNPITV